MSRPDTTLLLLAGGQGSRLGNQDKGLIELAGKPLVSRMQQRFGRNTPVLVSANRNLERYQQLGLNIISDETPDFPGPLAGLQAALQQCHTPLLLCLPCDTPFLPPDLPARLQQALDTAQADMAVPRTPVQTHPVIMLCRTALLPQLQAYLASGERKVSGWQERGRTVYVDFPDEGAFFNINTPEDLAEAEHRVREVKI